MKKLTLLGLLALTTGTVNAEPNKLTYVNVPFRPKNNLGGEDVKKVLERKYTALGDYKKKMLRQPVAFAKLHPKHFAEARGKVLTSADTWKSAHEGVVYAELLQKYNADIEARRKKLPSHSDKNLFQLSEE
jgi:hypothetical protein